MPDKKKSGLLDLKPKKFGAFEIDSDLWKLSKKSKRKNEWWI